MVSAGSAPQGLRSHPKDYVKDNFDWNCESVTEGVNRSRARQLRKYVTTLAVQLLPAFQLFSDTHPRCVGPFRAWG